MSVLTAISTLVSYRFRAPAPDWPVIVSQIAPPEGGRFQLMRFGSTAGGSPAIAPDGHSIVLPVLDDTGKVMLWVRSLDSEAAHPLPGTEGVSDPFWSPDGRAVGFFADHTLKTVDISGGTPVVLAAAPDQAGGTWNREGTILFVPDFSKGIYRVPASGGKPVPVMELHSADLTACAFLKFLSDGKHFLYRARGGNPEVQGIYLGSLDGKALRLLIRDGAFASYASGLLIYTRAGALTAQSFDPVLAQLKGNPHRIADHVATSVFSPGFDVSENGLLIYATGNLTERRLSWFDRRGKNIGVTGEPGDYYDVRLSPDGERLATNAGVPAGSRNSEVFIDELTRSTRMRLTVDPNTDHGVPVWSPDGRAIVFGAIVFGALGGNARRGIYLKSSNGMGREELLLGDDEATIWPSSWSHDGRFMLYSRGNINLHSADIWVLPLFGDRKPRLFLHTAAPVFDGEFSPNGRWVAYTSRESGRDEVFVVPFDSARVVGGGSAEVEGRRWQVSNAGGRCPRWRGDGKEISFLTPANDMMAAEIGEKPDGIEVRVTLALFKSDVQSTPFAPYDVTADGAKFVVNTAAASQTPLTLVVNWTTSLKNP